MKHHSGSGPVPVLTLAAFIPSTVNIASRVADERAVARGGLWAALGVYVELVSLLVQWDSGPRGEWLAHSFAGVVIVAVQIRQLRRPGRLVLHAPRAIGFLFLCVLFGANLVAWNGGPSTEQSEGMLVVLLPWPLVVAQALFATRHARADPARMAERAAPVAPVRTGLSRWHWLRSPRRAPAAPWFLAALALAGTGITLAVLHEHGVVTTPLARLPQLWVAAASLVAYRGLRHLQPPAAEVRAADTRAPVLILRAFNDDRLTMYRFAFVTRTTFEEIVARVMRPLGPIITVGDPQEPLPRLGAAREYLRGGDWRIAVDALICEAAKLVFILGDTDNLAWELRCVVARQRLADTLLLVPPVSERDAAERWAGLMKRDLGLPDRTLAASALPPGLVAVLFRRGQPVFVVSRRRGVADYAVTIREALALQAAGP